MASEILGYIVAGIMYGLSLCITNIHLTFVKKRVKKNDLEELDSVLPDYINVAEHLGFATGQDKKNYVMNLTTLWLSKKLKKPQEEIEKKYNDYISMKIEKLLELPQKKEK